MRVVHCKKESYDVYIGRPSKWGNVFSHLPGTLAEHRVSSREEAIEGYEKWIRGQPELLAALPEIAGKTLGCWCDPLPCHGEVLIRLCRERGLVPTPEFSPSHGEACPKCMYSPRMYRMLHTRVIEYSCYACGHTREERIMRR